MGLEMNIFKVQAVFQFAWVSLLGRYLGVSSAHVHILRVSQKYVSSRCLFVSIIFGQEYLYLNLDCNHRLVEPLLTLLCQSALKKLLQLTVSLGIGVTHLFQLNEPLSTVAQKLPVIMVCLPQWNLHVGLRSDRVGLVPNWNTTVSHCSYLKCSWFSSMNASQVDFQSNEIWLFCHLLYLSSFKVAF